MEDIQSPHRSAGARKKPAGKRQPLHIRLYFQRHMAELVQLVGYHDVPLDEISPRLAALDEQYGGEVMDAAREELLEVVERSFVRLKAEVRHLARQILGSSPDEITPSPRIASPTPTPASSPAIAEVRTDHLQPNPSQNVSPKQEPSQTEEERYLAAYEVHEETLYCCDRPNLKWFGEIGDLSVACESCGYVLFAHDELMPDGEPPGILIDAEPSVGES
jgi:hypothetical protein